MSYIPGENNQIEPEPENQKPKKIFKDYYADPEYRRKHLDRMKEKVECPDCGHITARANLTKHKRSKVHQQKAASNQKNTIIIRKELDMEKLKEIFFNVMKVYIKA